MFGIDPSDQEAMATLSEFFAGQGPISYYMRPIGYLFDARPTIEKIIAIYEKSPAFEKFEVLAQHAHMTKRECCALMSTIMRIAGVQGARQFAKIVLGAVHLGGVYGEPYDQTA